MTLRKYKQSRKMRKHPRKSLKSRRVAKRRKNVRRTRRGGRRGPEKFLNLIKGRSPLLSDTNKIDEESKEDIPLSQYTPGAKQPLIEAAEDPKKPLRIDI